MTEQTQEQVETDTSDAQNATTPDVQNADNVEHMDSSESRSELFGKNYAEISYKDLQLEKPLVGKFDTIGGLEKGYKELSAKLREKSPEAPEEYAFNLAEGIELPEGVEIGADDPLFSAASQAAKEAGLSQEAFDKMVNAYLAHELSGGVDTQAELEKLGAEREAILGEVKTFVDKFPAEEQELINQILTTAEGVKLVQKLKHMTGEKQAPGETPATIVDPQELWQKAQDFKRNTPNFDSNPAAQRKYDELAQAAVRAEMTAKR